jgi:hypothetical protein
MPHEMVPHVVNQRFGLENKCRSKLTPMLCISVFPRTNMSREMKPVLSRKQMPRETKPHLLSSAFLEHKHAARNANPLVDQSAFLENKHAARINPMVLSSVFPNSL